MSARAAIEAVLEDYLEEAVLPLCLQLTIAPIEEHREILEAMLDLRAEAGRALCVLGDAGWGAMVQRGKYQDGQEPSAHAALSRGGGASSPRRDSAAPHSSRT